MAEHRRRASLCAIIRSVRSAQAGQQKATGDRKAMMTAIGLMSGTSLDGIDVALIETDGERVAAFGPTGYRPYTDFERGLLREALAEAVSLSRRDARPGVIGEAERAVTLAHAEAVAAFIAQNRIVWEDIDIVGFHGQTVLHRPAQRLTVQIGDAAALAKAIRVPVMHDFRAADVAAGGQGAPFVPAYHRALAQSLSFQHHLYRRRRYIDCLRYRTGQRAAR
jgi:anhydro-N-acetylmuramic acid kinase